MSSITLCCILKNELENLPILLSSVKGCFDEICLVDTGSTDGSIELIRDYIKGSNPADTPIELRHFTWINDFSAARNCSIEGHKTEYLGWLDLDDSLKNPKAFIEWKEAMTLAEVWLAQYDYAHDESGKPACSFARERVFKNNIGIKFKYFVHEGLELTAKQYSAQYARTWAVSHRRTAADLAKDKSRNISLFDHHKGNLDSRMRYYYGKELFESGKPLEAHSELVKAAAEPSLAHHDRVLALQYACSAAMLCNQFDQAIQLAHQGLQLAPRRAEFLVIIGDSYLKKNQLIDALPFFEAAKMCKPVKDTSVAGPIFEYKDAYGVYPLKQLARIWMHIGNDEKAHALAMEAQIMGGDAETGALIAEIENIQEQIRPKNTKKVKEIVITCPPNANFYEWDEEIEKERGIGGSEIAAIRMARHLNTLTGFPVRIFNKKEGDKKDLNGVTYEPTLDAAKYFSRNTPLAHISWRHTTPLTTAPQFVWCHDLGVDGLDDPSRFTKVLALSQFHKRFIKNIFGLSEDKVLVTRNGIDANRFIGKEIKKQFGKVVWPSSPDRGLERAIRVMDKVIGDYPQAELHTYYGFDNMRKRGMLEEVRKYEKLFETRPWIKPHGNITQSALHDELREATVWFYPTNFMETFCITALETQICGAFGLVRHFGALPDTLSRFDGLPGAESVDFLGGRTSDRYACLSRDCANDDDALFWGEHLAKAITLGGITPANPNTLDWFDVAKDWLEFLPL
jgi:glycosyltransferase involved in cell wall biosynthesis